MTAGAPFLSVNNIEVIYDHVILVLKGVSLEVPQGKIVALLGANGAGKTTTLKAISNLLRGERGDVSKGSIEFRGKRVDRLTPSHLVKLGVVQVMEGRHCFGHLTVEENLLTGAYTRRSGRAEIRQDLERVYHYFPRLKERRTSLAGYTSGGEQQMTAIGRALMAQPSMILLDEPSMGLAPQLVEEIFEIVRDLHQNEDVSFYDALETRDPQVREREQFAALTQRIANAQRNAPYFARLLAGIGPAAITLAPEYPLIPFATGDLSAVLPGTSPCGRTHTRIKGWMGRADQTAKVKGMFVKPAQLAHVAERHREIRKYRLTIDHDDRKNDRMTLHCEVEEGAATALSDTIAASLRAVCNLRGEVVLKPLGVLPNDGKVIEDLRKYE